MINAAFISQVQGDVRQKLQKFEGFAGMNSSQLLKMATKVFVNQDQETKQEADRKMKRKMDLLAVALAKQSGRPWHAGHGRGKRYPCGQCGQCPQNGLTLERN
jgi:hypothetical protein